MRAVAPRLYQTLEDGTNGKNRTIRPVPVDPMRLKTRETHPWTESVERNRMSIRWKYFARQTELVRTP